MADTQNAIYAQAYSANIMQLAQQKYSKMLNTVYIKPNVRGKVFFQDQIGEWSMETKSGRNVATPNNDPNLARRMGTMVAYHDNRLLDRGDELKSISDPRSAYTIAAAGALGRKIDVVILDAMGGTAYSGETGSTSVTNGNTELVTKGAVLLADITSMNKTLDDADVEKDERYIVVTNEIIESMLGLEQATSSDYASIKALVRGELDTWMGFKWISSTQITSGATTSVGYAYHKYGLCAALSAAPLVRTDERPDLSYSWQVYYELDIGAVRLEEDRVIRIVSST